MLIIAALLFAFVILEKWVIDFDDIFESFFRNMTNASVFILFAVSESLFGLIPPDFFIIWARKFEHPWLIVTFLSVVSYLGGIVSYIIGRRVRQIKKLNEYLNRQFSDHFIKIKRWGSLFIIVAALFPLPYSTICMVSGVLKYPYKVFLLIGFSRILRFYLYALVLFGLIR